MSQDFIQKKAVLIVKRQKASAVETTIVVAKNVSKKAVERNRIKRIIREAIRTMNLESNLKIIVLKNIANLKMQDVQIKLEHLIKQI